MSRRKKIFERIVNPCMIKYLTPLALNETSLAKNIPMKYLKYFQEITGRGNGMRVRYKYRGTSKPHLNYRRPQANCHRRYADTFAVYPRVT